MSFIKPRCFSKIIKTSVYGCRCSRNHINRIGFQLKEKNAWCFSAKCGKLFSGGQFTDFSWSIISVYNWSWKARSFFIHRFTKVSIFLRITVLKMLGIHIEQMNYSIIVRIFVFDLIFSKVRALFWGHYVYMSLKFEILRAAKHFFNK